ncbi:VacJ family lipoprotein [Candidatus Pelagibacter sp.]|nr:VacJ family lipoprotein [Candidatus Pelagibacter sp.]
MIRFLKITFLSFFIATSAVAGSDGELELSKKNNSTKDCFEPLNRATFALNQGLDKAFFKPVAKGYRSLPPPIKKGTGNVLNNLSTLITIPNNVLQGDLKTAGINTGRLIVNTTIGILGIFDVASEMGFPSYVKEDYGQTLGTWGVGPGCYLVLPVLGPSTIRDTAGMFINVMGGDPYYNISVNGNNEYLDGELYAATKMLSAIEFRATNIESFDNLEKNSVDFYASVRSIYNQDRVNKIKNNQRGSIEVIYKEDEGWEEIDTK